MDKFTEEELNSNNNEEMPETKVFPTTTDEIIQGAFDEFKESDLVSAFRIVIKLDKKKESAKKEGNIADAEKFNSAINTIIERVDNISGRKKIQS